MKKLLLVVAVVALCGVFQNAKAQFSAGVGLAYATEINNLGISAQAAYDFTEEWAATGSFTYFLKKDGVKNSAIDLNANYIFTEIENVGKLYGLVGLNHWTVSTDKIVIAGVTIGGSSSETGVNLGAGLKMEMSEKMLLCPELKYSTTGSGYFSLGAKLMFKF